MFTLSLLAALPSLPDKEGFAGSFAGVSGGALLVAGGANFPDKKPWDGGKKVWHDTVFVLEKPNGEWKVAGKLPRPLASGVSATHGGGVVCVGGSDADRHYADVFRLDWKRGKLTVAQLPPLPRPLANACGAMVGDVLYVAFGQESPDGDALRDVYRLDLSAKGAQWEAAPRSPATSGRIHAVAAECNGQFWVFGGAELIRTRDKVERHYRSGVFRYTPGKQWERLKDVPRPVVGAPSPAPSDATGIYILGGDDGTQVGVAPGEHRGFSKAVLKYALPKHKSDAFRWVEVGELPPRVTTPCVKWGDAWVVPSGEVRPGVRSPEVFRFELKERP